MNTRAFRRLLPVLALALALPTTTAAQQAARTPAFALILEGVVEAGGDRVMEAFFEDGSTQTMRAGQGGTGAVGLEFRPNGASPFSVRGTAGYKFVTTAADNATILLTRIPVELVASYTMANDIRVGAGYVKHLNVHFQGDGFAPDADLESSHGATLEVGWKWVALTYTKLTYTDAAGNELDAGSFGVSVSAAVLRF